MRKTENEDKKPKEPVKELFSERELQEIVIFSKKSADYMEKLADIIKYTLRQATPRLPYEVAEKLDKY